MSTRRIAGIWAAFMAATVFSLTVLAAETADVELKEGYVDPRSGVKVQKIVVFPDQDMQEIHLAVPRSEPPMEEIVVTARRRSGETVLQLKPHEFVRDFDHNYYGLVIYLGKHETLPVRLYMDATQHEPGALEP